MKNIVPQLRLKGGRKLKHCLSRSNYAKCVDNSTKGIRGDEQRKCGEKIMNFAASRFSFLEFQVRAFVIVCRRETSFTAKCTISIETVERNDDGIVVVRKAFSVMVNRAMNY